MDSMPHECQAIVQANGFSNKSIILEKMMRNLSPNYKVKGGHKQNLCPKNCSFEYFWLRILSILDVIFVWSSRGLLL
jgi:hypothetical protein